MSDIKRTLELVCEGRLTEIRIFQGRRVSFGYFDDYDAAVEALQRYQQANAVYFTPNELDPSLLARSANRIKQSAGGDTTTDQNVVRRRWLLIDLDPVRAAKISSSEEEKDHALRKARTIYSHLAGQGFPKPFSADSGNGYHLLYRIDLPRDDDGLIAKCLKALDQWFSDDFVKVDLAVFNPARIFKLYGTMTRKGDDIPARPHRMSSILMEPSSNTVPLELLEALAAMYEEPPRPQYNSSRNTSSQFTVETWLREHHVEVLEGPTVLSDGRTRWRVPCPWDEGHRRDGAVFQSADGMPGFKCFHDSCSDKHWKEFRAHFEPEYLDRRNQPRQAQTNSPTPPSECEVNTRDDDNCDLQGQLQEEPQLRLSRLDASCAVSNFIAELDRETNAEIATGVPNLDAALGGGLAPGEYVILAARPSNGKTMCALQMAHHMSRHRPGLFITLDMSIRALAKRCLQYISSTPVEYWSVSQDDLLNEVNDHFEPRRALYFEENLRTPKEVTDAIRLYVAEEEISFVMIDYVQNLATPGRSRYDAVTEVSGQLRHVATETGVTVIALAQLNRELEKRDTMTPKLSDLKESGQLEQDADVVLGLVYPHRIKPADFQPTYYQAFVLKNRNRATGNPMVELNFNPPRQMLTRHQPPVEEPAPTRWEPD